jgi:hypothetical protein
MGLRFEKYFPWFAGCVCTAAWLFFSPRFVADLKEFLAASVSVGAIFAGFLATAKAILMAMPAGSVMDAIRKSGYIENLTSYLRDAIYGAVVFVLISFGGFFVIPSSQAAIVGWYPPSWVFSGIFCLTAFLRVCHLLFKILKHPISKS